MERHGAFRNFNSIQELRFVANERTLLSSHNDLLDRPAAAANRAGVPGTGTRLADRRAAQLCLLSPFRS
jgi:hypothetical protein